eukprot:COSAG02_NODE_26_length_51927_cov_61.213881_39_plen_157_part_00
MLGLGGAAAAAARLSGRSLAAVQRQVRRGLHGSDGAASGAPPEPVRVLCNGVWDMFHAGHANAWLQAKLCTGAPGQDVSIVVALHDSEDVHAKKGRPTVFDDAERRLMANGCKWVDETVPNVPYDIITEKLMDTHGALCLRLPPRLQVPSAGRFSS